MNYIAHLHLAAHTQTSYLGNFLGDFIKGSDLSHLHPSLEQGVRLHRSIDQFTDSHPLTITLKKQFPTNLRRMAGIVIDIYFDHILMTHWQKFTEQDHSILFAKFYSELADYQIEDNPDFTRLAGRLVEHQWLVEYKDEQTCFRAFQSIETRLKGKVQFSQLARKFILQNRALFIKAFQQFYPELLSHGLNWVNSNKRK